MPVAVLQLRSVIQSRVETDMRLRTCDNARCSSLLVLFLFGSGCGSSCSCAGDSAPPPVVAVAKSTAAAETPPPATAEDPGPVVAAPAVGRTEVALDALVSLLGQPALFPVAHASAPQSLQLLGPFASRQPVPELLQLVGPEEGTIRTELTYQRNAENTDWSFSQARFAVLPTTPSDLAGLYEQVARQLQTKLGKPPSLRHEEGRQFPRATWKLGKHVELWLSESSYALTGIPQGTKYLAIDVAEPDGR